MTKKPAPAKAPKGLTPKQDAFALAYMETGNAAEAYRRAYDIDPSKQASSWIYVEACLLLDNPKVSLRLKELQAEAAKLSLYSVKAAFDEYEMAQSLAAATKNPSAFISAINGKVKLFGLEAPAKMKHDHTSTDGTMTPRPSDINAASVAALVAKLTE